MNDVHCLTGFASCDEINDQIDNAKDQSETSDTQLNRLKEKLRLTLRVRRKGTQGVKRRVEALLEIIETRRGGRGVRRARRRQKTGRRLSNEVSIKANQCSTGNDADDGNDHRSKGRRRTGSTTRCKCLDEYFFDNKKTRNSPVTNREMAQIRRINPHQPPAKTFVVQKFAATFPNSVSKRISAASSSMMPMKMMKHFGQA